MSAAGAREIEPADFEQELRRGANVVVLDTRAPDAVAAWRVDPAAARFVNVTEDAIAADPGAALADLPAGVPVRVICNAGNQSLRVTEAIADRVADARSVRGGMLAWSRLLVESELALPTPTQVTQFRREARGCLSYLVVSGGEALVVDPAPDVDQYVARAEAMGARITHVVDTHVHADHLSGARELASRTGAALHLSEESIARGVGYAERVQPIRHGDAIPLGTARIDVVGLPGHTTDMTGLLVDGVALIGGDSLFADSVARPDLQAGDEGADEAARVLHRSLAERVGPLPDDVVLLPCHYAGGRLSGPIAPTLGEVRAAVPELSLDEDAFVERVLSGMPPRPTNYLSIIGVNLGEDVPADDAARLEVGANNCAARADWGLACR